MSRSHLSCLRSRHFMLNLPKTNILAFELCGIYRHRTTMSVMLLHEDQGSNLQTDMRSNNINSDLRWHVEKSMA